MKINQKQEEYNRQTNQEFQLCRLLSSLPHRQIPKSKIQSEFDDRDISNSPQTHLSNRSRGGIMKKDSQQQSLRKQRIKLKIKSQVRQKIKKLASRQLSLKRSSELQMSSRSHFLSVQVKSDLFHIPTPQKLDRIQQILQNCVIQPLQLHQKMQNKRNTRLRSRLIHNIIETRNQVKTSLNHRYPSIAKIKMSTPNLQNPEGLNDRLQPWRYSEQVPEQTFFKRFNPLH